MDRYLEGFLCDNGDKACRIALGTLYFGTKVAARDALEILDRYASLGGNHIDTARSYANWIAGGESASERVIGQWLLGSGMRRNVFLGTKGGLAPRGVNFTRSLLTSRTLSEELDISLDMLNTDYLDIYWLHRDNPEIPVGEIVDMCQELIDSGRTRRIGVSNWQSCRIEESVVYALSHRKQPFSMSQIQFGLGICTPDHWGDHTVVCMDDTEYRWYQSRQFPVVGYSAQAQGFYSVAATKGIEALDDDTRGKYLWGKNMTRLKRLEVFCKATGIRPSAVVMDYVLSREFPTVFLLGCSKSQRVSDAFADSNIHLSLVDWAHIL